MSQSDNNSQPKKITLTITKQTIGIIVLIAAITLLAVNDLRLETEINTTNHQLNLLINGTNLFYQQVTAWGAQINSEITSLQPTNAHK